LEAAPGSAASNDGHAADLAADMDA
jgi:hypothetical protein